MLTLAPSSSPQVQLDSDGFSLQPQEPGMIMAANYIRLQTMIDVCSAAAAAPLPELINVISRSAWPSVH